MSQRFSAVIGTQLSNESELAATKNALRESDLRFQTLADAFPEMVWSTLPDGFHDYYNARWYQFTGVPEGSTDGEEWNGMFHPDDQERAWARWRHSLDTGEPYEIEYRLRHRSGEYRWTLGRALPIRNGKGDIIRWMGTCTDIHKQKEQADHNEILSRELAHRIKNIFAVIGGLIGLSARRAPEHRAFAMTLQQRIAALGRAHEFVRPHSEQSQPSVESGSLHAVLAEILSPYPALEEGRIVIGGEDFTVDDRGATPIALLTHELATNATKYGALSNPDGTVAIDMKHVGENMVMQWIERGGPELQAPPAHEGFGSKLAEMSIVNQLGGRFERRWPSSGLEAIIEVPIDRLARSLSEKA
jgi:PAS domain S-box-containing protein